MSPERNYHRMSVAEKERVTRENMREPAIVCQYCETKTTIDDLLTHIAERCPRRRPPHPRGRWIAWREALRLGASRASMTRWVSSGYVMVIGEQGHRRYLMRDVVKMIAANMSSGTVGGIEAPAAPKPHKERRPKPRRKSWLDGRRPR